MIILISRLFGLGVAIVGGLLVLHDWQQKRIGTIFLVGWQMIWLTVITLALFPHIPELIIQKTGGKTGFGTLLGISMVISLFISYRLYQQITDLTARLNKLIQEIALNKR